MKVLTKSRFKLGFECPNKLYLQIIMSMQIRIAQGNNAPADI